MRQGQPSYGEIGVERLNFRELHAGDLGQLFLTRAVSGASLYNPLEKSEKTLFGPVILRFFHYLAF